MEHARTATSQANGGKSAGIEKKEKEEGKKETFQELFCFGFLVLLWVGLMWLTQHDVPRQDRFVCEERSVKVSTST